MKLGITGFTGFVGKRLMEYNEQKFTLCPINIKETDISGISLKGIDTIVHLAGKAHQMQPIKEKIYFEVNYELTRQLALRARDEEVKQFIYISSTKVYGDEVEQVLDEQSPCNPIDAYGASKLKAEQFLLTLDSPDFIVSIIRPPLIYGPGVKGNMIKLLQLAFKKYPLFLGNINNARTMVFVDNLIELINTIALKSRAGIFIAGDIQPISTSSLVRFMRSNLKNNSRLISIPGFLRQLIRRFKPALYLRLFGSFVVDNTNTNKQLEFTPPYTTEYGIQKMTKWFLEELQKPSNTVR
jgi:nucleoside-diphosphate-sugar epimerase